MPKNKAMNGSAKTAARGANVARSKANAARKEAYRLRHTCSPNAGKARAARRSDT